MAKEPTLGYWRLRGITEPIRYLLHYSGVKFNDKRYADFGEWQKDKFKLGLDFPNLPYFIDGHIKITQSVAILRYLGHKYHLDGETEEEKIRLAIVEQQLLDFRASLTRLAYGEKFEEEKTAFLKNVPAQLRLFESFLGDGKFFVGDRITYVDFLAYEVFDFYRLFSPALCDDVPMLRRFHDRIRKLPELQDYLTSSEYVRWPIFGPTAKFGGGGEEPKHA